jgi:D-amino peptidase
MTGEFGMNSALAGHYGVPSVFLAGDYAATVEAEAFVPGITTASVKWAMGRYSAKCLHPNVAAKLIKKMAKKALIKEYPAPRVVDSPVEVKVKLATSTQADVSSLIPSLERVDGTTMKGVNDDYQTAINALRACIYMAGAAERR